MNGYKRNLERKTHRGDGKGRRTERWRKEFMYNVYVDFGVGRRKKNREERVF